MRAGAQLVPAVAGNAIGMLSVGLVIKRYFLADPVPFGFYLLSTAYLIVFPPELAATNLPPSSAPSLPWPVMDF